MKRELVVSAIVLSLLLSGMTVAHFERGEAVFEIDVIHHDEEVNIDEDLAIKYIVQGAGDIEGIQDIPVVIDGGSIVIQEASSPVPGEETIEGWDWTLGDDIEITNDTEETLVPIDVEENQSGNETDDLSSFLSDYWWVILLVVIGAVIAMIWKKMRPPDQQPSQERLQHPQQMEETPLHTDQPENKR